MFHVVPEAQLVSWEVLVLARTHNEEYVAVEVRLAEVQAAGDAFSADFNFAGGALVQSESIVGAHDKVVSLVNKFKGDGRHFFGENILHLINNYKSCSH